MIVLANSAAQVATRQRLETWLQRLIDDRGLRDQFLATPSAACETIGMPLSWSEMGALLAIPYAYWDEFAKGLPVGPQEAWQDELDHCSPRPH